MARAGSIVVAIVVSMLASCTEKAPYWTPEGGDTTLAGRWTVHGAAADDTTCAAAGIDQVALVFVHEGVDVDVGTFTFPCAQGAFDSRPGAVLAAGSYDVRWLFTTPGDAGASSFETTTTPIVATPGGHVDVPAGDFP